MLGTVERRTRICTKGEVAVRASWRCEETVAKRPSDRLIRWMETALNLLKPNDLAQRLAVSRAWVYEAAKSGRIPSVRIGGVDGPLRFVPEDIERLLAEARTAWLPGRAEDGDGGSVRVDAHAAQTAGTPSSSRPSRPSGRSEQEPLF